MPADQERSQLHALRLAARKRARRLPELNVSQPHVGQRAKLVGNFLLLVGGKKLHRLVDGQLENVADRLALKLNLEHVGHKALAVALLALQVHVGHKLHFDGYVAVALAHGAASAVGIEREVLGRIPAQLGRFLVCKQVADVVVGLEVGHRIRPRRLAHGVLVDDLDGADAPPVSGQLVKGAGSPAVFAKQFLKGGHENVPHQRGFARTADAADCGQALERNPHRDVLEVLRPGAPKLDPVAGFGSERSATHLLAPREVVAGQGRGEGQAASGTRVHHFATEATGSGTNVNHGVGCAHEHVVVLDHNDGIAGVAKRLQHAQKLVCVARVQAHRGLVQNVH